MKVFPSNQALPLPLNVLVHKHSVTYKGQYIALKILIPTSQSQRPIARS